ncbi:MAG: DUF4405 domain-containing protein [Bacteroidales bacterium]|jgi:membrane protein YdbS with pleckstrin-like domain|nr:DUF4405 domain-containing protein [Bacteroidales bacterium]
MKTSNKRAIVSIGLVILFIALLLSAAMIQITEVNHRGSFAHHAWTAVHVLCGIIFTTFGIFHIVFNWRTLKSYIKNK